MGKVYQSVRGMVQGTLNRKRTDMAVPVQPGENTGLDNAMDALEKGVVSGLARLKVSVRDNQALAASKVQQAEQVIVGLRAKVAGLEAQLREAQETVRRKEAASQKMEESLGAEIRALQSAVKQKEEALDNRDSEINGLKSQTDVLGKQVSDLESAIQRTKEAAASEAHRAEQVIEDLRANLTALEGKLKEAEDNAARKDAASQKMEAGLGAEIHDLQSAVKQKEEALDDRDSEINDLKSQTDVLGKQVSDLELAIQQTKEAAASAADRAGQVILDLGAKVARLEAQLRAGEETVQRKEAGSQKMKESLEVEIRELQSAVKQKEEAVESRDSEINDLKSQTDVMAKQVAQLELAIEQTKGAAAIEAQNAGQVIEGLRANIATLKAQLKQTEQVVKEPGPTIKEVDQHRDRPVIELHAGLEPQTSGINEMSSFSEGAKASAGTQAQGVVARGRLTSEEKPAASRFQAARVPSMATEFPNETVPQDAFDSMIAEFSERANVIRSMASLIVRHHVRTLGESMEEFPQTRLPELVESLSGEISDAKLKANFRERFGKA